MDEIAPDLVVDMSEAEDILSMEAVDNGVRGVEELIDMSLYLRLSGSYKKCNSVLSTLKKIVHRKNISRFLVEIQRHGNHQNTQEKRDMEIYL